MELAPKRSAAVWHDATRKMQVLVTGFIEPETARKPRNLLLHQLAQTPDDGQDPGASWGSSMRSLIVPTSTALSGL